MFVEWVFAGTSAPCPWFVVTTKSPCFHYSRFWSDQTTPMMMWINSNLVFSWLITREDHKLHLRDFLPMSGIIWLPISSAPSLITRTIVTGHHSYVLLSSGYVSIGSRYMAMMAIPHSRGQWWQARKSQWRIWPQWFTREISSVRSSYGPLPIPIPLFFRTMPATSHRQVLQRCLMMALDSSLQSLIRRSVITQASQTNDISVLQSTSTTLYGGHWRQPQDRRWKRLHRSTACVLSSPHELNLHKLLNWPETWRLVRCNNVDELKHTPSTRLRRIVSLFWIHLVERWTNLSEQLNFRHSQLR